MNSLRQITYRPSVIKLARWLGLRAILRRGYYWWARPSDGILKLQIAGVAVQFHVHNAEELRVLESEGGAGGERQVLELLVRFLRAGDVVYDVGSNVGLYTVLLAKAVGDQGSVIAFEPQHECFAHLGENLALNGVTPVRSFHKALGETSGQARLYSSKVIGNSSLVRQNEDDANTEIVEIASGDELAAAEHLPGPRVVKIDVEGYEYSVIQGLRKTLAQTSCELVCCEVHPSLLPAGVTPDMVVSLLDSLGFRHIETFPRWDGTSHLAAYKQEVRSA
jgi:FkbM family methyltransferase